MILCEPRGLGLQYRRGDGAGRPVGSEDLIEEHWISVAAGY